ncbi:hypothetical protein DPMN_191558 [Dreissena polymorpha]|uniref:Uncharacterized protein n=1 Tax=Dreissena polymorpha TaxID=45954 RepID=A0A9D3Y1H7_DREPO|nr:hypothetical protein DPMN_191558 [Dreissena polymorpha]
MPDTSRQWTTVPRGLTEVSDGEKRSHRRSPTGSGTPRVYDGAKRSPRQSPTGSDSLGRC